MQTLAVVGQPPSEVGTPGGSRCHTAILFALSHALIPTEVFMDFDPRSIDDWRERHVDGRELNQGSRGGSSNPRERERLEPRDVFTRDLELPRGRERERVWARDSDVTLRGSEVLTLATVGAFRVAPAGDLRDGQHPPLDPQSGRSQASKRLGPGRDDSGNRGGPGAGRPHRARTRRSGVPTGGPVCTVKS